MLTGWFLLVVKAGHGQGKDGIRFNGGYVGYSYYYRSNLDTPYTEKNIGQHQVLSTLNLVVAGMIPLRVNSFIRRSNSSIFRDITDVQVAFDAAAYRNSLVSKMREGLAGKMPDTDTVLGKLYKMRQAKALQLESWLHDPLTGQKLIEANEILKVPYLTYDMSQSDSTNRQKEDSMRRMAADFLSLYKKTKGRYDSLSAQADSLKKRYDKAVDDRRRYMQLIRGEFGGVTSYERWKRELQQYAPGTGELPAGMRWLLGVRTLGIGKNNASTSELTARNVSLNGINFVYNSWYYLGVTAGLVDYRFRDFVIHPLQTSKQYMYVLRAGLGQLERNFFILSAFGGRKQLLTTNGSNDGTVKFTGVGAEARWQLHRNSYVIAEAAQSFAPVFRSDGTVGKPTWNLSDRSNKSLSLKFYSWWPSTGTRLEWQYKFLGANYQSFNAFQTNTELRAWYVKAEQSFFKRQLKLVASLRANDYSNPYIVQNYKANTVFKSLGLTFNRRGLPVVSVGYLPMSQLTRVGGQVQESRFQTLNASVSHFYRIGLRQASSTVVYTRFFNSSLDSGFLYYNAGNVYVGQTVFFRDFTATMAFSHSSSPGYQYNVLESNVSFQVLKNVSLGLGAKLNELSQQEAKLGAFCSGSYLIGKGDQLSFRVEKGYLPGNGKAAKLAPDLFGNISFMKVL